MKVDRRELLVALVPALLLALWGAALFGVLALTLEDEPREALAALLEGRLALLVMLWALAALALGALARKLFAHWALAPARLAEQAQVLVESPVQRSLEPIGAAPVRVLAGVINELVQQRGSLREHIEQRVKEASRAVEQERSRLAALMSELTQSVVVCNLDGRVLLYNNRARWQFRALGEATTAGAELIGIGRSIYAVLDRQLVAHALESVQQRLARGVAHPSAQFVTATRGGQLLRVQLAAVRGIDEQGSLNGFVLMLHNITRALAEERQRDQMLHTLSEGSRASLANLQAAVELLDEPGLEAEQRERFQGVVREEVAAMVRRINALASHTVQTIKTRWPLEDIQGADFVSAAQRRIEAARACRVSVGEVDPELWLKVDSFSLLQLLSHLAGRLVDDHGVKLILLRLQRGGEHSRERAQLDLGWIGPSMSTETVTAWETEPIGGDDASSALTVRDIIERHGGAFWFERERVRHESFFRVLLPLAPTAAAAEALDSSQLLQHDSRPEYYDFDLFQHRGGDAALADTPLIDLAYTVFDTETTGLAPSQGGGILQSGAARIVAGKLRRGERFEQLVDPERDIPAAGIPIHGIEPQMVQGKPVLKAVLPGFHAFAADTVLVAHNAAFDMRFLQLAEAETGVCFTQPVLDTLLLSAVVHPQQESHRLEAIAERLGVPVLGRHTALGDAIVTAEVFVKLLPLLAAMGIRTLGQAIEASEKTYYARVQY